jgi:hypothetical protein
VPQDWERLKDWWASGFLGSFHPITAAHPESRVEAYAEVTPRFFEPN